MDGPALVSRHRLVGEVHRVTEDVEHSTKGLGSDRHGNRSARVERHHPPLHPVGRGHRHRAHPALSEVLLDLGDDVDVRSLAPGNPKGVVDGRQMPIVELDVDHGTDDLDNLAGLGVCF